MATRAPKKPSREEELLLEVVQVLYAICRWPDNQDVPFHQLIDQGKAVLAKIYSEGETPKGDIN